MGAAAGRVFTFETIFANQKMTIVNYSEAASSATTAAKRETQQQAEIAAAPTPPVLATLRRRESLLRRLERTSPSAAKTRAGTRRGSAPRIA